MIPRYSRPIMKKIWDEENKFKIWFKIEAYAADGMASNGTIPKEAAKKIWELGKFEIDRINEIEKETKHDVIAFLTNLSENIGPEARFLHQGMTSSDVLDTTLSVQMVQATDILLEGLKKLLSSIKKRAFEHKNSICIGRSHGIHAEPTTFGLKLASFYAEFDRSYERLSRARDEISVCAISGAVGTFANIDPSVETYVASKMGLKPETISTQVIPRDRHASWFSCLSIIASSIERLAVEIRSLQRTEIREVEEYFSSGQKGSSAMPHKRNPVLTENLTGIARIVRASVIPAMENVALWHERDISHSSVERVFAPDASIALDFAIARMNNVIENLLIYPDRMKENMDQLKGLVNSQQVLLKLTQSNISREDAYSIVQEIAMQVWDGKGSFLSLLKENKTIKDKISEEELVELFDENYHTKNTDFIFNRVFKDE
jgi:adenylosuccinate lyase